ncbi:type II toxin-antitoxin system VapB family antitoxin [Nostoc sp.]|uniref:type II toxin-antitoxin system VapB family antitoxin n=1 Tax=Nostoc sp. TaxID=1180 RepID=UPI002FF6167C
MTSQTRDITETLIAQLQTLPPEQQQMVVNFVEFLAQKHAQSQPSQNRKKRRVAGLHEGMGWISDDFNEPLPDEFWMGE